MTALTFSEESGPVLGSLEIFSESNTESSSELLDTVERGDLIRLSGQTIGVGKCAA